MQPYSPFLLWIGLSGLVLFVRVVESKQWPVLRFVRTLSFFDQLPNPLNPLGFLKKSSKATTCSKMERGSVLFSSTVPLDFGPLDDVVMGGVSKTDLVGGPFTGVFGGVVSTDNNGGFAGIRTKMFEPARDISSSAGFALKIKGDGNRYKFIIRDDEQWNGIAWSQSFDTKSGERSTVVKLPVSAFKPTRFAKTVTGGPPFNKRNLRGLQITLSKFEVRTKRYLTQVIFHKKTLPPLTTPPILTSRYTNTV